MAAKALSYEELMELAKQNYTKGGDATYECWDKKQFDRYVDQFGPMTKTKAMKMFKLDYELEIEQMAMSNW